MVAVKRFLRVCLAVIAVVVVRHVVDVARRTPFPNLLLLKNLSATAFCLIAALPRRLNRAPRRRVIRSHHPGDEENGARAARRPF